MLRNKAQLMGEVALRLRVELDRLRQQLPQGAIAKEDEELIERLRKTGAVIDELGIQAHDVERRLDGLRGKKIAQQSASDLN